MSQGTIKRLVSDRGFGFIDTGTGNDLFFHVSALDGLSFETLFEGQQVEYEEGQGQRGPCAIQVRPVSTGT